MGKTIEPMGSQLFTGFYDTRSAFNVSRFKFRHFAARQRSLTLANRVIALN
jgi:hypothetical protein